MNKEEKEVVVDQSDDQYGFETVCACLQVLFRDDEEKGEFFIEEITRELFKIGVIHDDYDHFTNEVPYFNFPDPQTSEDIKLELQNDTFKSHNAPGPTLCAFCRRGSDRCRCEHA